MFERNLSEVCVFQLITYSLLAMMVTAKKQCTASAAVPQESSYVDSGTLTILWRLQQPSNGQNEFILSFFDFFHATKFNRISSTKHRTKKVIMSFGHLDKPDCIDTLSVILHQW